MSGLAFTDNWLENLSYPKINQEVNHALEGSGFPLHPISQALRASPDKVHIALSCLMIYNLQP